MRKVRSREDENAKPAGVWLARGLESAGDVAYELDLAADRLRWTAHGDRVFGLTASLGPVPRDDMRRRIHPDDLALVDTTLERHLATGQPFEAEYRVRAPDGRFVWVQDRGAVAQDTKGGGLGLYGVMRVVAPHQDRDARLERMANYDELTGHFNLRRLREQLEFQLASARYGGRTGVFLSVVIDDVQLLGDVYGREVADAAVIGLGQQLDRCLGESDVAGRTGPDSFGVILDGCPTKDMVDAAETISAKINGAAFATPVGPMRLTVSVGAATFPGSPNAASEIVALADQRARDHKKETKAKPGETGERLVDQDLAMLERVRWCLENDGIRLVFQPVVASRSGGIAFFECLLRPVPRSGLADEAGPLVHAAERVGLIRNVDRRVLELVLARLESDPGLVVSVNVSGVTTLDPQWLRRLVAVAHTQPDLPKRMVVEITETAALQDLEESARFVATLRDMGCRVALDDFGAGHTSFLTLKALPVDLIKIDGSFVTGLARVPAEAAFVRALTGIAEACGKATVAECVDDEATAQLLKDCGVDYLQGYLYGRPAPLPDKHEAPLGFLDAVSA